jgi:glutamyl-tRNA reductase
MHLVVTGISQKTAPLELRERLALTRDEAARLARRLLDCGPIAEAVVLSTCNRTEVYLFTDDAPAAVRCAVERLAAYQGVDAGELRAAIYEKDGDAAIRHLFRVAASLDSLVVGEAQIVAQLKDAYQAACGEGCTSTVFNKLFRHALEVGKRVRSETTIGQRPVSVSSVAVDLARQVLGKLDRRVVLVLGAGETSELTVRHLQAQGVGAVVVANRTLARAEELAARCEGRAVCFDELDEQLVAADIVISSTGSRGFVIDRARFADIMRRRRHRPLFVIDIAVPRDFDPAVGRLEQCYLYDIDDLQGVVAANRHQRERQVAQADRIVAEELARMNEWLAGLEVVPTIAQLRSTIDGIREAELARLAGPLSELSPAQRAQVEQLTTAIVNKILHLPTVRMKELATERDVSVYVDALRRLFDLDEPDSGTAMALVPAPASGTASTLAPAPACDADAAPATPVAAEAGAPEAAPSAPLASPAQAS